MEINNFDKIKNHIDFKSSQIISDISESVENALKLTDYLLGATLVINKKIFILNMLELYYGSVRDINHDWYRNEFNKKNKYRKINYANIQKEKGFKLYFRNKNYNAKNKRNRIDLVIGNEEVAVSLLIRNAIQIVDNEKGVNISGKFKAGTPNLVLGNIYYDKIYGHKDLVHIKNISDLNEKSDNLFLNNFLIDTHELFFRKNNLIIEKNKRVINKNYCGLEGIYKNELWNRSFYLPNYSIPEEITKLNNY